MRKKIIAVITLLALTLICAVGLIACGDNGGKDDPTPTPTSTPSLEYELINGGTEYSVVGIGTCKDTEIEIPDTYNKKSVTRVGNHAFYKCDKILSVKIPESVKSIGKNAFYGCGLLSKVTLPDSLEEIGEGAFSACEVLKRINSEVDGVYNIPANVNKIGGSAFSDCVLIENVNLGEKVVELGDKVFYNCISLVGIVIPDNVEALGEEIFSGCVSLKKATIGESVKRIGRKAFYDCNKLTSINLPSSIKEIEESAFLDCFKLVEVINKSKLKIVKGSTDNGQVGFYALNIKKDGDSEVVDNDGYLFYSYDSNNYLLGYVGNDEKLKLPEDYKKQNYEIYQYAFYKYENITDIEIPKKVIKIGDSAFYGCISLSSLNLPEQITDIGESAFFGCSLLESINIPQDIKTIEDFTFKDCSLLKRLNSKIDGVFNLPKEIESIGESAFYNCQKLVSVEIPEKVKNILDSAFEKCPKLQSVKLPNALEELGNDVFLDCDSLKYNEYSNSYYLGNDTNKYLVLVKAISPSITSCSINEGCKFISSSAFAFCSSLKNIEVTENVISIGKYAFYSCNLLSSVVISKGVTSLSDFLFYHCGSLESLIIPDDVTEIGDSVFEGCIALVDLKIPEKVTEIGDSTFKGCSSLRNIVLPNKLELLGDDAFENCNSLNYKDDGKALYIGNGGNEYMVLVKSKTDEKISDYSVNGNCKFICSSAFYGRSELLSVEIADKVIGVGGSAFYGCNALQIVNYTGTADSWAQITFGDYFANPISQTGELFIDNVLLTEASLTTAKEIKDFTFYNCNSLYTVTLGEDVEEMGDDAFYNCYRIIEVINKSKLEIVEGSMDNGYVSYSALKVKKDGTSDIVNKDGLLFYTLEKKNYLIGNLNSEKELVLPEKYEKQGYDIYQYAFYDSKITSVKISEAVENIGEYAFCNCNFLTSIVIPKNVESIGDGAFLGCYKLVEVINESEIKIEKGSLDNGYVGYYALNVKEEGPSDIVNKDGYLFYTYEKKNYLLGYVGDDTELILPDKFDKQIYEIYQYAFYNDINIKSITVSKYIENIGNYVFNGCSLLESITFIDADNWYRTDDYNNWKEKTDGKETDLSTPSENVKFFKTTYQDCYWYKDKEVVK